MIHFKKYQTRLKKDLSDVELIQIDRNDPCYCGSEVKYKICHMHKNEKRNRKAYKIVDRKTGQVQIGIFKNKTMKVKSNLTWNDIGVGSTDKIE